MLVQRGLFDLRRREIVVSRDVFNFFTRIDSASNRRSRYAFAENHRPAERDARIDSDRTIIAAVDPVNKGIKPNWKFRFVPIHAFQMRFEEFSHRELPR